jgi:hypothetical protein
VNLDGGWQLTRDSDGIIHPDPQLFPNGIAAVADYVHSKNLKFGLYSGILTIFFFYCSLLSNNRSSEFRCWIQNMWRKAWVAWL